MNFISLFLAFPLKKKTKKIVVHPSIPSPQQDPHLGKSPVGRSGPGEICSNGLTEEIRWIIPSGKLT